MAKKEELELAGQGGGLELTGDILAEMEAVSNAAKQDIDLNEDVRLPSLRLVQATTQDAGDARPGQIIDTMTGEAFDEVEILPVTFFKSRALFGGNAIGDPPTCSSPNALDGYGEFGDTLTAKGPLGGGDCRTCPQSSWRTGGKCQLRFNYLGLMIGDDASMLGIDLPRGIMLHGTSAKVASRLNSMLIAQKFLWSNTMVLSSVQEKNDRGTYKVWQVRKGRPAGNPEMLAAFGVSKQVAVSKSVSFEDERAPVAGATSSDVPF